MVENKCSVTHKFGPFILNNNKGIATRKCFCCNETVIYNNIGDDIKNAILRQDDVSLFAGVIISKEYNDNSDNFIKLIRFLLDDIDYLYINEDTQNKLLNNIGYYNSLLNKDDNQRFKFIEDIKEYLKLFFAMNKYEYKLGAGSFPADETEKIDELFDYINKSFDEILLEKKHLSK
ncbi:MAG: hypothetical protein IJI49_05010 [Bacilli bacterium]|nr:hypothetical protein [Bacilli bacterium]